MLNQDAIVEIKKGVVEPNVIEVDGTKHLITPNEATVRAFKPEVPSTLKVQSLSGLVAYIANADPVKELWEGDSQYLIHIIGHDHVEVLSNLEPKYMMRRRYVYAEAPANCFQTDNYMTIENFIISVMSNFQQDDNAHLLLKFASGVQALHQQDVSDDGVAQTATVKKGVVSMAEEKVPNPIQLTPYATFPEIVQPTRSYVFRMKQVKPEDPVYCGLFTITSERWKVEAVDFIREWLNEQIDSRKLPAVVIS